MQRPRRMTIRREGGDCAKIMLMIYTLLFWTSGLALMFLGLWMLLDPKRNYVLDLVDFSEDTPLLTFAAYIAIAAGCFTLFVGFVGFCGAIKRMRCLLVGFILCLLVLFLADIAMGVLAISYRNKFENGRMPVYLSNMTNNRYYRDKWVKPLLDTVQFYVASENSTIKTELRNIVKFTYGVNLEIEQNRRMTSVLDKLQFFEECCGASSADDFLGSRWMAAVSSDPAIEDEEPPLVPVSCCRQLYGASARNPVARSHARCQQALPNKQWRHTIQQCCGGYGPRDYYNSFWFITNTERGTRSFVPQSCCKQAQSGRAWAVVPIDPMCTTYNYFTSAFNSSVNAVGCHEKLIHWFDEQTYIFAGVGFGFAFLMLIGMLLSLWLCSSVRYYSYIKDDM